jgi:hypothetical protein
MYSLSVHQLERFVVQSSKFSRKVAMEKLAEEERIIGKLSDPIRIKIAEKRIEILRSML